MSSERNGTALKILLAAVIIIFTGPIGLFFILLYHINKTGKELDEEDPEDIDQDLSN